ncbi:MAG: hypothetical protein IKP95_09600 [Ruminococcus sp.]|nr:hypothetical protein [Ruminococcus sp.]
MKVKVTYRERMFIGDYRCIDHERTISVERTFRNGNILYCCLDRFNVIAISNEDIIRIGDD